MRPGENIQVIRWVLRVRVCANHAREHEEPREHIKLQQQQQQQLLLLEYDRAHHTPPPLRPATPNN